MTIILLVLILVVLVIVVIVIVIINKTRPQKQVDDKVDLLEIRPQIFLEAKNTINPMLTRGTGGTGGSGELQWQAMIDATNADADADVAIEWDPATSPSSPYLDPALDPDTPQQTKRSSVMMWIAPPPEDVCVGDASEADEAPAMRVQQARLEWDDGVPGSSGTSSRGDAKSSSGMSTSTSVSSVRERVMALETGRFGMERTSTSYSS